jgi:signal transduction histidine kinase
LAGWGMELEKDLASIEQAVAGEGISKEARAALWQAVESIKSRTTAWMEDAKRSVPIEENALKRLAHRLKNWAEYGRIVSEGFRGQRQQEAVHVGDAAKLSIERWRPFAERKGLSINTSISGNPLIWGERTLIEQIIENLIDNALKATDKGRVDVRCSVLRGDVLVEVEDTGCGIPAEDLTTIFDKPFYQGKGRETLEQSTGVGLYLVGQYAKSLGGKVSAESTPGKGSTFRVSIPLYKGQETRAGAAA